MEHLSLFTAGLAALLAAATLRSAGRAVGWAGRFAAPAGLLAGAIVLRLPFDLRAFWAPRVVADHLLLVAAFGAAVTALAPRLGRQTLLLAAAMLTGWWVAQAPPALPEFWRVGLAVTALAFLLMQRAHGDVLAASLAGSLAMWLAGAAPVWREAPLIAAGACAALLGAAPSPAAGAFLAAAVALASLSSGRIMSGRAGPVEAAVLAAVLAAHAWPLLQRRIERRLRRVRPPAKRDARVAVRRRKT